MARSNGLKAKVEAAPIQAVEQRKIRALCGNDHFAADFMLEPMPAAKLDH
jgi:hypothetical protein